MNLIPAPRRRRKPDFSLTMVNIVFLLLLFYLATSSLIKKSELETDIPVTAELPLERLPRPLLLLGEDGLFLDGRSLPPAEAAAQARRALDALPGAVFLNVLADRATSAEAFLDIVAGIQEAGVPIRIVTLHDRLQTETADP